MKNYLYEIDKAIETDPYENVYTDNGILFVNSFVEKKQYIQSTFSTYGERYTYSIPISGFWDWYKIGKDESLKKSLDKAIDIIPNVRKHFGIKVHRKLKRKVKEVKQQEDTLKISPKRIKASTTKKDLEKELAINNDSSNNIQNIISIKLQGGRTSFFQNIKKKLKISDLSDYVSVTKMSDEASKMSFYFNDTKVFVCIDMTCKSADIIQFMKLFYSFYNIYPIIIAIKDPIYLKIYCYSSIRGKIEKHKFFTINSSIEAIWSDVYSVLIQGEKDICRNIKKYHKSIGIEKINKNDLQKEILKSRKEKMTDFCKSVPKLHWYYDDIPCMFYLNKSYKRLDNRPARFIPTSIYVPTIIDDLLKELTLRYIELFGIKPVLITHDAASETYYASIYNYNCVPFDSFDLAREYAIKYWNNWKVHYNYKEEVER